MALTKKRMDELYLDLAKRIAEMSFSARSKVGGVLVKDGNIISFGWNGTPHGFDNKCEDTSNVTLPIVVHAEQNIIAKLARHSGNAQGACLYLTLSPCFECSKLIIQSGISRVVYLEEYRDTAPLKFLESAKIMCQHRKDI